MPKPSKELRLRKTTNDHKRPRRKVTELSYYKKAAASVWLVFMLSVFLFAQKAGVSKSSGEAKSTAAGLQPYMESLAKTLKTAAASEDRLKAGEALAPIQEQIGLYAEAAATYGSAASLAGVQTLRGQKLLLGSVRCSLSCGDVSGADFLLSTAFASVSDTNIKASVKLYALWSWIIKVQTEKELEGPVSVLQTYVSAQDMLSVRPALLLTLYRITGEKKWAQKLQSDFPDSPEAAVCAGNARLLPAPFWFFFNPAPFPIQAEGS